MGLAVNLKYLGTLSMHPVTRQIFCYIVVLLAETMSYERIFLEPFPKAVHSYVIQ